MVYYSFEEIKQYTNKGLVYAYLAGGGTVGTISFYYDKDYKAAVATGMLTGLVLVLSLLFRRRAGKGLDRIKGEFGLMEDALKFEERGKIEESRKIREKLFRLDDYRQKKVENL